MKRIIPMAIFAMLFSVPCFAQTVDEDVIQDVAPDGQMQSRMIIASDDGSGAAPNIAFMSSDGAMMGDMMLSTDLVGGAWGMGAPDVFALAQNSGIQKEIELVDEQVEQLREINADFSKRIQDQMAEMRNGDGNFDVSRAKGLGEMIKKLNAEKQERMQGVFLPHQFDRLQQISLQSQMKRQGNSSMLANKLVVEALGLSEKEQKALKKKAKELKDELQKDIEELKAKSRESLFKELTADQRKKLKELLGDDYEVKTQSMQERFQRIRGKRDSQTEDK